LLLEATAEADRLFFIFTEFGQHSDQKVMLEPQGFYYNSE
jgi:hypothetical protein